LGEPQFIGFVILIFFIGRKRLFDIIGINFLLINAYCGEDALLDEEIQISP
jgi:hypothetical protein